MKKILLGFLTILLVIICYRSIRSGIGLFNVPSIITINDSKKNLDQKNSEAHEVSTTTFDKAMNELNTNKTSFEKAKSDYEEVVALVSSSEYASFGDLERYKLEFIWIKLGIIAKENNVSAKFDLVPATSETDTSLYNIEFTILGNYIDIIDFMYSIEDDDNLRFIVENVNMIPVEVPVEKVEKETVAGEEDTKSDEETKESSITMVQATFTTKGITVLN